jgi:hypothetical protein
MIKIRSAALARGLKTLGTGGQINNNHYRQKHRLVASINTWVEEDLR